MNTQTALSIIFDWRKIVLGRRGISREAQPHLVDSIGSKPIKIVTGFRRTGKSYLVQLIARKLIDDGPFRTDNVLYLNFEDYRLMGVVNPEKLGDVYNAFLQSSEKPGQRLVIFDEIQQVANWERFIRTIYSKGNLEIIITGSNSSLLSAELGGGLAGRFVEFSIHPLSFGEFLRYRGHVITSRKGIPPQSARSPEAI